MKIVLRLTLVWTALAALLALTIAGSFVFTAPASVFVSLGIAAAKAGLIYWFFMHLKEESGLVRLFALGVAAWLLMLFLLSASDYATRAAS